MATPFLNSTDPSISALKQVLSLESDNLGDNFGVSVSAAGDLNNDGVDDVIMGAHTSSGNGAAYIVFGRSSGLVSKNLNPINLSALKSGFKISGTSGSHFGYSVSRAGDINKDGMDDIVIGADVSLGNNWNCLCYFWPKWPIYRY